MYALRQTGWLVGYLIGYHSSALCRGTTSLSHNRNGELFEVVIGCCFNAFIYKFIHFDDSNAL